MSVDTRSSLAEAAKLHDDAIASPETKRVILIGGVCATQSILDRAAEHITDTLTDRFGKTDLEPTAYTLRHIARHPEVFKRVQNSYLLVNSAAMVAAVEAALHNGHRLPTAMTGIASPRITDFDRMLWSTPDVVLGTNLDPWSWAGVLGETALNGGLYVSYGKRAARTDSIAYAALMQNAGVPMDLVSHRQDGFFKDTAEVLGYAVGLGVNVHAVNGGHNRIFSDADGLMAEYFSSKSAIMNQVQAA